MASYRLLGVNQDRSFRLGSGLEAIVMLLAKLRSQRDFRGSRMQSGSRLWECDAVVVSNHGGRQLDGAIAML